MNSLGYCYVHQSDIIFALTTTYPMLSKPRAHFLSQILHTLSRHIYFHLCVTFDSPLETFVTYHQVHNTHHICHSSTELRYSNHVSRDNQYQSDQLLQLPGILIGIYMPVNRFKVDR